MNMTLLMLLKVHLSNRFRINILNRCQAHISQPQDATFLEMTQYFWYIVANNLNRLPQYILPQ